MTVAVGCTGGKHRWSRWPRSSPRGCAAPGVERRRRAPRHGARVTAPGRGGGPGRGRRSAVAARPGRHRLPGAAPAHRPAHRRRHGRRRRRLAAAGCARARRPAARRPADGARRAVRRRRLGPHLGGRRCSTASPAEGDAARPRRRQPAASSALWELLGDPVAGLDLVGRLLGAQGRVLPMSSVPLDIEADVVGLDPDDPDRGRTGARAGRRGDDTPGEVRRVRLVPPEPPACAEAVAAVERPTGWCSGPGSWFTACCRTCWCPQLRGPRARTPRAPARHPQPGREAGETEGFSPGRHISRCSAARPRARHRRRARRPAAVTDAGGSAARPALGAG